MEICGEAAVYPEPGQASFMAAFRRGYLDNPHRAAIICELQSVTYADAYNKARSFASYLAHTAGVRPGDAVAVSTWNRAWFPLLAAAVQECGATLVLLPGGAEAPEMARALELFAPKVAIVDDPAHCEDLLALGSDAIPLTLECRYPGVGSVEGCAAAHRSLVKAPPQGLSDESRIVLFTSGSTGKPKAVVNRSASFWRSGKAQATVLHAAPEDVCYIPVPFTHTYGMVSLYTAFLNQATVLTAVKYRPNTSLSLVAEMRATLYFGVPTMYLRELAANEHGNWDVSPLRAGLVAGSSCPEAVFAEYEERYGCRLAQCYGMTETAATLAASSLEYPAAIRATSVGRPIGGVTLRLAPDTNEICARTPSLMEGLKQEDGSLDAGLDAEGWLHTGDVGRIDDEGRLYITGRIKDMIIRGGINIYPAEVESLYQEHPAVAECCMVGYPDADLGERSCMCVVPSADADETAFNLRNYAKGLIEKCKIPDVVLKMDDFPRLGSGKVDKKALKAQVVGALAQPVRGGGRKG